jgi:uncharacterized damage-inducible protein DinB
MTALDYVIETWREVRNGLVDELSNFPADNIDFRPATGSRSVAELIQHIVKAQKVVVGELCREDTNFGGVSVAELHQKYASGVDAVNDKAGLVGLLETSMDDSEAALRTFGDQKLGESIKGRGGYERPKIEMLRTSVSHESYHRGQLTVYERVLGIEPAFTAKVNKMRAAAR